MVACSGSEKLKMNVDQSTAGVSDYFELLQPRVMSLAIFTAIIGLLVTPNHVHPLLAVFSIIAIGAGAGAAGAINMWYDRDIDLIMDRTKSRPIPSGRVKSEEALTLGIVLSIFSIILLFVASNYIAAAFLFISIMFYTFIYTIWLKRYTVQNIVIGGAAGAFPPVIGQVCASGTIGFESLILFLIIFVWTPPHFWALALIKKDDYAAAKIPMLPIIAGEKVTRKNIFIYSLLLVPCSYLPWIFDFSGNFYLIITTIFGIEFLRRSFLILKEVEGSEKNLFLYSIFYLSIIFAGICFDKII